MASLGLAYAYDAWKVARVFADEAKAVEELQRGVLVNMTSTADLASLESMALKVVTLANEAAAVLEDALEHAPAHAIEGRGAINANPRSEAVRRMKTAFETLSAEATRTTIREE
jgi:hypothetical protein